MGIKIKDSSISFDDSIGMYHLDIGSHSAWFDSIYYCIDGVERIFGDGIREVFGSVHSFHAFKNCIIGISKFFGHSLIRIYSSQNDEWKTFFFQEGKLSSFDIGENRYFVFIYLDPLGNLDYSTNLMDKFIYLDEACRLHYSQDLMGKDYSFQFSDGRLRLNSTLFETEIYSWSIPVKTSKDIPYREMGTDFCMDVADVFLFTDPFSGDNHTKYGNFLKSLSGKRLPTSGQSYFVLSVQENTTDFFSFFSIKIYYHLEKGEKIHLGDIQKLLLSYLPEYCLVSAIDNLEISKWFDRITKVNFSNFSLDHLSDFSHRLYEYRSDSMTSWKSFLQIQYNFSILKMNLRQINALLTSLSDSDPHYEALRTRNLINKSNIESVLPQYEKHLRYMMDSLRKDIDPSYHV